MKKAAAEFGAIDVLVNNAGIQHVAPVDEFPPEKWDAIIAINLVSNFHTIRHALPGMKEKGWGRIINIASAHALVASPFKSAYVAAKHGVAGSDENCGAGSRGAGHHGQCDLSRLCAHAAGGETDPRHRQSARHHRAAGDQRCAARRATDQEIRDGRAGGGDGDSIWRPIRRRRSPARSCRWMAAGPLLKRFSSTLLPRLCSPPRIGNNA